MRNAAVRGEQLDTTKIGCVDARGLGQWLYGSGRALWGKNPRFVDLIERHAGFHREACRVAQALNDGRGSEGVRTMGNDTPFAKAMKAKVMAIRALQVEVDRAPPAAHHARPAVAATAPRPAQAAAEAMAAGAADRETVEPRCFTGAVLDAVQLARPDQQAFSRPTWPDDVGRPVNVGNTLPCCR